MHTTQAHQDPRRRGPARGFTLIESIVAIGAMALVAVGIAAIFQTVGRTISGGKRVSALNAYAAMIENQMRRDFESITRDGFFVIRNSYADANGDGQFTVSANQALNTDAVPLDVLDTRPRPRRVDEVLFFAAGDFASSREPLNGNYVAKSNAARIYYGHGMRMPAIGDPTNLNSRYYWPQITDSFSTADAGPLGDPDPIGGVANPNQYASSWTLLRHEALLIKPDTSTQALPIGNVFNYNPQGLARTRLYDKYGQIQLQPAAWSLFRRVNLNLDATLAQNLYVRTGQTNQTSSRPAISSGLVDIVNSDLNDVRTLITAMGRAPGTVDSPAECIPVGTVPVGGIQAQTRIQQARAWMDEAFPTNSDPTNPAPDAGWRMRYEPGPPGYVGAITTGSVIERAFRRVDQLALSASNFVPGCTEFIVEWSFGKIDDGAAGSQEMIWHGLARSVDAGGNGLLGDAGDRSAALPYPDYQRPTGAVVQRLAVLQYPNDTGGTYDYTVRANLISLPVANMLSRSWYFGYIDPLIDPATVAPLDGYVPWPWPKLVRVTMTLTDPANPTSEETFQFVFSVGKPSL